MALFHFFLGSLVFSILHYHMADAVEIDRSPREIGMPSSESLLDKSNNLQSFKKMDILPSSYTEIVKKGRRALSSQPHTVVFAIKKLGMDKLQTILEDISDPNSPNYGNYMTRDQINAMTANHEGSSKVLHSLGHYSVDEEKVEVLASTPNNDFITARASIRLWENFFNTEFYVFERKQSRSGMALRAMEYSLHSELADHVLCVFNVADVPFIQKTSRVEHSGPTAPELSRMAAASPSGGVTLPGYVTPALLNKVYHIDSNIGSAEVSQGVYETNNEWFSPADLAAFQSFMGLPNQPVATNIGGHSSDAVCRLHPDLCDEGNFDLQYLMGVSQVTPTTYYYINEVHFMLDWLTAMASSPSPPKVLSVSWGGNDHHFPVSQMTAVNHEAITLSAMGVTLIAGSGDDGANSYTRPVKCGYMTKFPASSPYFTAVGATNGLQFDMPESACQSDKDDGYITSGGGVSVRTNSTPAWQARQVSNYFANYKSDLAPGYNPIGRGLPDVSLLGASYLFILNNSTSSFYGTSTSAPVFAGMVSLVNAARVAAGKPTLGWINPALYALSSQFVNDITVGDNKCTSSYDDNGLFCCAQGFKTAVGWDPVTGLGSVNFTRFKDAFLSIPIIRSRGPTPTPSVRYSPTVKPKPKPKPTTTTKPRMKPTYIPTVVLNGAPPMATIAAPVPTSLASAKPSKRGANPNTALPTMNPSTTRPTTTTAPVTTTTIPSKVNPTLKSSGKPITRRPSRMSTKRPTRAITAIPTVTSSSFPSSANPSSSQPSAVPTSQLPSMPSTSTSASPSPTAKPSRKPVKATTPKPTTKPTISA